MTPALQVQLRESLFRNQASLFLFQRWKASPPLSRDGGVLPELVARRVGRLHFGSVPRTSCQPSAVAGCVRTEQGVAHATGHFPESVRYAITLFTERRHWKAL
jgi:hypothetical protein